jgi:hypothetical protein
VGWIVRLVQTGAEGVGRITDILEIERPDNLGDIATLGLTLSDAKRLLAGLQREFVAGQARAHSILRPNCPCGRGVRHVKDYREHAIATLFGQVIARLPRFRRTACGAIEVGIEWPSHCRSTPELDRVQAHLSALMAYRTAADVLEQMFPVGVGKDKETMRRHTLRAGAALRDSAATGSNAKAAAISVTLDATFIRSREDGERYLEARIGNVEAETGGRQVFGAIARSGTAIAAEIRRNLDAVGRTEHTVLTAFTDGCPGLRAILTEAGIDDPPILDWFHLGMRLQHLKQIADALSCDDPSREAAKAVIVDEVERLRWRIWNGKATDARKSIVIIRAFMHHFRGESGGRNSAAPSRRLWTALRALDVYLIGQSDWLVNYAERHRAGLRVGTAITEGTANFLVNRRMNKSQQMRWSRNGADLLLQVRCAVYNGTFGSDHGRKFQPANDPFPPTALAA